MSGIITILYYHTEHCKDIVAYASIIASRLDLKIRLRCLLMSITTIIHILRN